MKPHSYLNDVLVATVPRKDRIPDMTQSHVVYRIPCNCGKFYIGETARRLETRVKEHKGACEKGMTERSAIAEHAWIEHHPIAWKEAGKRLQ